MKYEGKVWNGESWCDALQEIKPPLKERRELAKISGVYAIEIEGFNSAYVGQSVNIKGRWSQHKHVLRRGTCEIERMQELWNLAPDKFQFKILETTKAGLRQKEQQYAEEYVKKGFELLNSCFIVKPTSIMMDDVYKPLVLKIIKLHTKGRLDISQLDCYLDTL
jgi:hypothetical protein